jgi:hypothetical protein
MTVFCMLFFLATVAWAADPFLGTWTADIERIRQQLKNVPPGTIGDRFKVEVYKDGYKFTQTIGQGPHAPTYVTTVDFKTGVTAARDSQGEEIDRVKVVRISPTEIETTSLKSGTTLNYHIIEGGNEIEVKIARKGGKTYLAGYYKRAL